MLKIKRCRYISLSASLFVFCLIACGGDEESNTSSESANANRNTATPPALYTEATTPIAVKDGAVYGLEIPSLGAGNVNAFIVHTLPDGTLNYCCGYNTELRTSAWTAYKWYNGSSSSFTKYNTKSIWGKVDNKTVLDPKDDVAHVKLGGSWRMPTDAEWMELKNNCTWTWTTQNGINGYKVTSNKNGASIFLPAAGYRYDTFLI